MTDGRKTLAELRAKIEEKRKELEEQEKALAVLEKMLEQGSFQTQSTKTAGPEAERPAPAPLPEDGVINLEDLGVDVETRSRTLSDDVASVVRRLGEQEFTVAHVDAVMARLGMMQDGTTRPRARISQALGKLEDDGLIVRTFSGAGNVPHRYKLAPPKEEENTAGGLFGSAEDML